MVSARLEAGEIGKLRDEGAVDEHEAARASMRCERGERVLGAAL